jgi:D-arabinose 1-dehydrogenase-like Zn-dependent alcohol dehydrogenase
MHVIVYRPPGADLIPERFDMAKLPQDMLAARCLRYHASPPLELVRIPLPLPGPNEVLIKVTAASLCHTDIAMCLGDKVNEGNSIPQTAGHEPCGTVVMAGSRVKGFLEGDRVGFVNHAGSCGQSQAIRHNSRERR